MERLWKKLIDEFPGWEIHHTGGGIFVIRKDFTDVNGNLVMLSISDDLALVTRDINNKDRFITHKEFLENEDVYWEEAGNNEFYEEVFFVEDAVIKKSDKAGIFGPEVQMEIKEAMGKLSDIIWS